MVETLYRSHRLKYVDDRSKKIIFGYIREIESILSSYTPKFPEDIKNLCILFYFEFEQFDECSAKLQISSSSEYKENDIVEQIESSGWYNVYGKTIIDPKECPDAIYLWTLLFTKDVTRYQSIFSPPIGIISVQKIKMISFDDYCFSGFTGPPFYCWETWNQRARLTGNLGKGKEYGKQKGLKQDDTVEMEFDVKNKSLRFYLNGNDLGIAHNDIDLDAKYKLGMSFASKTHKMQLINFEIK